MTTTTTPNIPVNDSSEASSPRLSTTICSAACDLIDQAQRAKNNRTTKTLLHYALCLQEAAGGYYNEGTARIYFLMAWYHYERNELISAMTYFLQCIRISLELNGEDDTTTQLLLDDLKDLLEDMHLNEDCVNPVFDSWALQDDAFAFKGNKALESKYLKEALQLIPADLEMERATIYIRLAQIYQTNHQAEHALSFYCQALMILPHWLSLDHPQVVAIKIQTHQVAANLTPIIPRCRISREKMAAWQRRELLPSSSYPSRRNRIASSE